MRVQPLSCRDQWTPTVPASAPLPGRPADQPRGPPDGKRMSCHRDVKFGEYEDEQIFSVDLNGEAEQQLTSGPYLSGWAKPGMVRRRSR